MVTQNCIDTQNPVQVSRGGTGDASFSSPYSVICGGVSSTDPLQKVASLGTSGQVLTSQDAGALPQYNSTADGPFRFIDSQTASTSAFLSFDISSGLFHKFMLKGFTWSADSNFGCQYSTDGGSTWLTTGYVSADITFGNVSVNNPVLNDGSTSMVILASTTTHLPGGSPGHIRGSVELVKSNPASIRHFMEYPRFLNSPPGYVSGYLSYGNIGSNSDPGPYTNIRFLFSSGTITTGTIYHYTLATS